MQGEWPDFHFKSFSVSQKGAVHPVGTDAVLLGAWAPAQGLRRFLDIGTGTGVIALMMAQRTDAEGVGVELHAVSAALARSNFDASPWASRLSVWQGSIQDYAAEAGGQFDLIVSNPPFFSETTVSPNAERSLGRHTDTLPPTDFLKAVSRLLAPEGKCCLILPEKEGRKWCEMAVTQGLYWTVLTEVGSRPGKAVERLLICLEKTPYGFKSDRINVYAAEKGDELSPEYREMTQDFYLR